MLRFSHPFYGLFAGLLVFSLAGCDEGIGFAFTQFGVTDGNNDVVKPVQWQNDKAEIRDVIFPFADYDCYDLGTVRIGDRFRFTVDPLLLGAGLLLVDADAETMIDGLDGNAPSRPSIEFVAPNDIANLHLFVGPGHIRIPPVEILPIPTMGDYHVTIEVLGRGGPVPGPRRQTVVLDFKGGTDVHYFGHPIQIEPFDAGAYNDALAGSDDAIRRNAVASVLSIYRDFDLDVRSTDDLPPDGPASRIYITVPGFFQVGSTNFAGGQVRYIDFGNRDHEDVGIVSPSKYPGTDVRAFGRRLGQLAAHEIGHLLGLVHQEDGLMSYNNNPELISGPVGGFFGFTDPTNVTLFPTSPRLIQPTREYLTATIGPRTGELPPAKAKQPPLKPRKRIRR